MNPDDAEYDVKRVPGRNESKSRPDDLCDRMSVRKDVPSIAVR